MRFLSLLAIASIAFCVSMCTPNPANNVTPVATGNCYDGTQNGSEQGVDCGTGGCTFACNGTFTAVFNNGTPLKTGIIQTVTVTNGQYASSYSPIVYVNYSKAQFTNIIFYTGSVSYSHVLQLSFSYAQGSPVVGSYAYTNNPSGSPTNSLLNKFTVTPSLISAGTGCTPTSGTGTLNITSVNTTTRKMSGNFSATLQCSGSYPISGTFTDVSY
jgi:hypothetical protein